MKPRFSYLFFSLLCTLTATHAQADFTDVDGVRTYTGNNNTSIDLTTVPSDNTKVIFDMSAGTTNNHFANKNQTYTGEIQIGNGTDTQGLIINNGYGKKTVFSGKVTGSGVIAKTNNGKNENIVFSGDVTEYTGNITLGAAVNFTLQFGDATFTPATTSMAGASGTGSITFTSGVNTLVYNYAAGANPVYVTNSIAKSGSGVSKVTLSGAAAMEFTQSVVIDTLTIGNSAAQVTFHSGSLGTVSGTAAGLVKAGSGALAISNLGGSAMTLNEGSLTGTLTNGTLVAGAGGTLGTADAGFTLNGGVIDFGNAATTATLSATGTIDFISGALRVGNLDSLTIGETYVLLNGTNLAWNSTDFSRMTINGNDIDANGFFYNTIDGVTLKGQFSLDNNNSLLLNMWELASKVVTWNGGDGTWQNGGTGWNAEESVDGSASFRTDDEVVFGGNSSPETITIVGEVNPLTVTVTQGEYIFEAGEAGSVSGLGTLTVGNGTDAAKLTVNTANSYWKGTVNLQTAATLVLGNADALGESTIAFNGGQLQYGSGVTTDISGQIVAGTGAVRVDTGGNNVTWATDVLASHAIEKSGAGALTLTLAGGAYSHALTVSEGDVTLNVASGTATYAGAITGNGAVVKSGAGMLLINSTTTLTGIDLRVDSGTLKLGNNYNTALAATVAPKSVVLGNNATLQFLGSPSTLSSKLTMGNGSMLKIEDSRPTNPTFAAPSLQLTGQVTLSEGTAKIDCQYGRALRIDGQITGQGKLQMTTSRNNTLDWGGNFYIYLTNENNDFSGGIELLRQDGHLQVTNAGALGTGILNLSHAQSTLHYAGTANADGTYDSMKGGTDQKIIGNGGVEVISGNLELKNANIYTGATTVTAGSLKVSGSVGTGASANAYVVKNGASLVVSGTGSIANSSVAISAQQPAVAPLSDDTPAAEGTLRNVTVNTTKITRTDAAAQATIDNGKIDIAAATYTIENVALTNSLITLQNAGALTLSNVTIGAGTSISGASAVTLGGNTTLVMTQTNTQLGTATLNTDTHTLSVSSDALVHTSVSGSLTLDLTEQWVYALVDAVGAQGHFTTIALNFTDVDETAWAAFRATGESNLAATGALSGFPGFNVSFGDAAGQVMISTAPQNIPEPATATLSLAGLAALLLRRRRRA